jgi:hypothetical protein
MPHVNLRTLLALLLGSYFLGASTALAVEGQNPWEPRLPAEPLYTPDQRLLISEPEAGTILLPPHRVTVFFRRSDFDLVPSSLQVWVDNVEVTESLKFWVDRAWWEPPAGWTWNPGEHQIRALIQDASGQLFQQTQISQYLPIWLAGNRPWPFNPTAEPNVVSNLMEDWQTFSGTPYWHGGLDIREDSFTEVHACAGGQVVRVIQYRPDPLYWSVMVRDAYGFIWQYHHMNPSTIAVSEGMNVSTGDVLGRISAWPNLMNGDYYNHLHLNVASWLGGGAIPKPYVDGYQYWNPLLFLTQGSYTDSIPPYLFDVWYAGNESATALAADSDAGTPVVSGDIDIVARLRDRMTTIGTIEGQPYEMGIYKIDYSIKPLGLSCSPAWVPRTTLARFDKLPGGKIVNTQNVMLNTIYKQSFSKGVDTFASTFDYNFQELYYVVTNSHFGVPDGPLGLWDTNLVDKLGVHFPDGNYQVTIYATDFYGNETATSTTVTTQNGLSPVAICPDLYQAINFHGALNLQGAGGGSSGMIPGSAPVSFGPINEGSAFATIASPDWPVWTFDFPATGMRVEIGMLANHVAQAEIVPLLGDVILDVPAEVQVFQVGPGGGHFNPNAPSTHPLHLRLSTRLARDPWTGEGRIGRPTDLGHTTFTLVTAETLNVNGQVMRLDSGPGLLAEWSLGASGVDNRPRTPLPVELALHASPTPFRSTVEVKVESTLSSSVQVDILDVNGRLVQRLHEGSLAEGEHTFSWDGRTGSGSFAPAGLYFAAARTNHRVAAQKIVRVGP